MDLPDTGEKTINSKVRSIIRVLQDKKAEEIKVLDVSKLTWVADYMVIATGTAAVQIKAMAEAVDDEFREKPVSIEGFETNWILLDYNDVIVHIFLPESKLFYNLEKLWPDAKITTIFE